jgi:hypothetical protein
LAASDRVKPSGPLFDQLERGIDQRLPQVAVVIAAFSHPRCRGRRRSWSSGTARSSVLAVVVERRSTAWIAASRARRLSSERITVQGAVTLWMRSGLADGLGIGVPLLQPLDVDPG